MRAVPQIHSAHLVPRLCTRPPLVQSTGGGWYKAWAFNRIESVGQSPGVLFQGGTVCVKVWQEQDAGGAADQQSGVTAVSCQR